MTASNQPKPHPAHDIFAEVEDQWAIANLLQDIQNTGHILTPTNVKYFKGLLCGHTVAKIAEILGVEKGTVKTAIGRYISPAIKVLLKIDDIKAFTDIPSLLQHYRRYQINLPRVSNFYGRHRELKMLTDAITLAPRHFIMIHGRGGVGKTYLISKWAADIGHQFSYCIRLEMGEPRAFEQLIWDIMQYLPTFIKEDMPIGISNQITWLLSALTKYKCLIIFDDIHHLFHSDSSMKDIDNTDKEKQSACETLFRRLATDFHNSCIVSIGWHKPLGYERIEQPNPSDTASTLSITYLQLEGLEFEDAQYILRDYGLREDIDCWKELVKNYRGFPYSLKIVSKHISGLTYEKDVRKFLLANTFYLGKSKTLIFEQFKVLPEECQLLLLILAQRGTISITELRTHLSESYSLPWSTSDISEALEVLHNSGLIESHDRKVSPPPDITKYILKDCQWLLPQLLNQLAP